MRNHYSLAESKHTSSIEQIQEGSVWIPHTHEENLSAVIHTDMRLVQYQIAPDGCEYGVLKIILPKIYHQSLRGV